MKVRSSLVRSKVARRMFALFIACALVPVTALALISMWQVGERSRKESVDLLKHTSKNVGMSVIAVLATMQESLQSMAEGDLSLALLRHRGRGEAHYRFRSLTLFDQGGGRALFGTPCPFPQLTPSAQRHLAAGNMIVFLAPGDAATSRILVAAKRPGEGDLLVAEVNPEYLWEKVGYTLPRGASVCILGSGKVLYRSSAPPPGVLREVAAKMGQNAVGQFRSRHGEEEFYVGYWSIFLDDLFRAPPLTVVATQPVRDALKAAGGSARIFYLVAFLTLALATFMSSIQIRRSLVPLAVLRDAACEISLGNFDHRVRVESGDEFQTLADSFNEMSAQLKKHFRNLSEMGRIARNILAGHDVGKIVAAVTDNVGHVLCCQWLCLSVIDSSLPGFTHNTYSLADASSLETVSPLSEQEATLLRQTREPIVVASEGGAFAALLAPIRTEGDWTCYLIPILLRDRLAGVLTLGYRCREQAQEDLLRGRQLADEIAVALENVHLIKELNHLNTGIIRALANAVDAKSPWTAGHSLRVTSVALNIAKEMGLADRELETLQKAGLFHDIGKIGVPEALLDKPGKLTDEECATVKRHPEIGVEIMAPIHGYRDLIPMVLQHHEWFNGEGYPQGLSGEAITLGARILAVADVYDALISDRPYRVGWEYPRVLRYLEEKSGSQFDPEVVRAVLRISDRTRLERTVEHPRFLDPERGIEPWNSSAPYAG